MELRVASWSTGTCPVLSGAHPRVPYLRFSSSVLTVKRNSWQASKNSRGRPPSTSLKGSIGCSRQLSFLRLTSGDCLLGLAETRYGARLPDTPVGRANCDRVQGSKSSRYRAMPVALNRPIVSPPNHRSPVVFSTRPSRPASLSRREQRKHRGSISRRQELASAGSPLQAVSAYFPAAGRLQKVHR